MTDEATIRYLYGILYNYEDLLSPDDIYAVKNAISIITELKNEVNNLKRKEANMVNCTNCVRKEQCDLYLESNGKVNKESCMCKTVRNDDGSLDNNTRRYLAHEELL